jgi:hypothetical protein
MKRLLTILAALTWLALGGDAFAASTLSATLSQSSYTDLGAAPVQVQTLNGYALIVVADSPPSSPSTGGTSLIVGPPIIFQQADSASHVYALAYAGVAVVSYAPSLPTGNNAATPIYAVDQPPPPANRNFPGCTVAATSGTCLAGSTAQNFLQAQNTSTSAQIACAFGATAVLNSSTSFQLAPGQSVSWGPNTYGVPKGAMNCIASVASSPLYVEWY